MANQQSTTKQETTGSETLDNEIRTFEVNGLKVEARYSKKTAEQTLLPLLREWTEMRKKKGSRLVIFLAAPPAVGKSTLVSFLSWLSRQDESLTEVQGLGLDGFHYPQEFLNTHTIQVDGKTVSMASVKGHPDTFDAQGFLEKMQQIQQEGIRFPEYSRTLHNPQPEKIAVTGKIVLIEGNWLLRDEERWKQSLPFADQTLFIQADPKDLKERLIQRKMQGGMDRKSAEAFYETSDGPNITRVLEQSVPADRTLIMDSEGGYVLRKD